MMASDYLDHNATTPLDARVLADMQPYLQGAVGNPSSIHRYGRQVRSAIDKARQQLALLLGVNVAQVVFTSGGTEANNLALKGVAGTFSPGHIIIGATEHSSVVQSALALERQGWRLDWLGVDDNGRTCSELLMSLLCDDTRLVSLMMANNETGVITDIAAISAAMQGQAAVLHCDAVQALGKVAVDFAASGAGLMSLSGHKINGPAGIGALIIDRSIELQPLLHGGGQEAGLRSGTENVAAIVGFGRAAELALAERSVRYEQMLALRQRLEQRLQTELPGLVVFAREAERLPNTVFFAVPGMAGETLVMALDDDGFAVASGSACSSSNNAPSHVLMAMGVDDELARCAVRVSLGPENDVETVDRFVDSLKQQVHKLTTNRAALAW